MGRDQNRPTVPEVLPLVNAYYALPGNGTGGSLHIVLDDANVEDHSVEFCVECARSEGDDFGEQLATILLAMSRTQRYKLYDKHDYPPLGPPRDLVLESEQLLHDRLPQLLLYPLAEDREEE